MILTIISLAALAVVLAPDPALAWGAGMHVAQGSFILDHLYMVRPEIAAILQSYPFDYIYGCISADIFIGKGYKRRDDHCHNWSVGMKVLHAAKSESTKSYAYGYLTHLAADVIAHNHLIPNLLYATPTSRRIGHVYWEFKADRFIHMKHWRLASDVVSMHNHGNDTLIKRVMNRSMLRFGAKKLLFRRAVSMSDLTEWMDTVQGFMGNFSAIADALRVLSRGKVSQLNNCSINLIVDLLKNWDDAVCLKYDPVGTDNTINSKLTRKSHGLALSIHRKEDLFPVPEEIAGLNYVDHKTERM
ncbi:MAG: zinc dependent phospholipase C family protein [Nitrospinae bacterium]|nr:zinc dependent phospholipase C family protein [Nitrospinota bacterium]